MSSGATIINGSTGKDVCGGHSYSSSPFWLLARRSARLLTRVSVWGFSMCHGVFTAWQLDSKREHTEKECPDREYPRGRGRNCKASRDLASEIMQPGFCHILLVISKSSQPAHNQEEENQTPPVDGRSVKEYKAVFNLA